MSLGDCTRGTGAVSVVDCTVYTGLVVGLKWTVDTHACMYVCKHIV